MLDAREAGKRLPRSCSEVGSADGYLPQAMLFVDEGFAQCAEAREGKMANLIFRPVVRFCSTHYKYERDAEGKPFIVQVGVSAERNGNGLNFARPSSLPGRGEGAKFS